MKIAIVSDSMSACGGADRCIEQLLLMCPPADLFTAFDVAPQDQRSFLRGHVPKSTFPQQAIAEAVKTFEHHPDRFSEARFHSQFGSFVNRVIEARSTERARASEDFGWIPPTLRPELVPEASAVD